MYMYVFRLQIFQQSDTVPSGHRILFLEHT